MIKTPGVSMGLKAYLILFLQVEVLLLHIMGLLTRPSFRIGSAKVFPKSQFNSYLKVVAVNQGHLNNTTQGSRFKPIFIGGFSDIGFDEI